MVQDVFELIFDDSLDSELRKFDQIRYNIENSITFGRLEQYDNINLLKINEIHLLKKTKYTQGRRMK